MGKNIYLILFWLALAAGAQAQELLPLPADPARANAADPRYAGYQSRLGAVLTLPFFDDFAESDVQLNPERWVQRGGTYVNNNYPKNPPSKNVVSIDGLNADGQPYQFATLSQQIPRGPVDTLTSRPIDLSAFTPNDSVYLSFFYQAGGYGHEPAGSNRYLIVEFKSGNGNWVMPSDGQIFAPATSEFVQKMIRIPGGLTPAGLSYYHNSFQFRLRGVGYRAGAADVWNLDYFYLNSGRTRNDTAYFDVATTNSPTQFLAPYTALPIKHYLANPQGNTASAVTQGAGNLYSVFRIMQYKAVVRNRQLGTEALLRDTINTFEAFTHYNLTVNNTQNNVIDNTLQPRELEYRFFLISPPGSQEPYQNRHNDTISRVHNLSNYFAYDDGTAERAYNLLPGNQVAIKFNLSVPDTLRAVDLYYVPFKDNVQNNSLSIRVWAANANGLPDTDNLLANFTTTVNYGGVNQFRRIVLPNEVPVNGSFFIGWAQGNSLAGKGFVGFDRNTNGTQTRFSSSGGSFLPDTLAGTLMIRAIMGGQEIVSAPAETETPNVAIYPNPGTGLFQIRGTYDALEVYDLNGRLLQLPGQSGNRLDLRGKPAGLYLVRVRKGETYSTHKLMLTQN